ncbi:hypothetical protein E2C01_062078 [Portunus trituberculatus]|uniref:Uncharacterized protein n=1 Tax=Portunus trituberculatus TaxID=210409 RepID=A0A5B7HA02_PORTR|nr:hypothetical protein [Portunus trituberculatus]
MRIARRSDAVDSLAPPLHSVWVPRASLPGGTLSILNTPLRDRSLAPSTPFTDATRSMETKTARNQVFH